MGDVRVLMVVRSDVAHDARVVREAVALVAAGYRVHVVGRDVPARWVPPEGVTVSGVGARSALAGVRPTAGRRLPAHLRLARWLLLPHHNESTWRSFLAAVRAEVTRLDPDGEGWDVVHAHDFPVLPLAVELADRWGADVVYDSHEWWSGRFLEQRPTPLRSRRQVALERSLGRRAAAVLTVSDGIAERFRTWGWDHVHVVRNTFPTADARALDLPRQPTGLVYAGRVGLGRDLETLVAAATPDLPLTLIGPADPVLLGRLSYDPAVVTVLPEVAPDDVDDVVAANGIALITLADNCENHRLALPNKLFHAVRAGVPVVAADLPEMARLVERHGLGAVYRPGDPESLAAAARAVRDDYPAIRARVLAARSELSWEQDASVLVAAYSGLGCARGAAGTAGRSPGGGQLSSG